MPATSNPLIPTPKNDAATTATPGWSSVPALDCNDRIIIGLEQEYGVSGQQSNGEAIEPRLASELVREQLNRNIPWLPDDHDPASSAYYPWGGRGYIDCGHFEGTTGEAGSPSFLLAQVFAMHQSVAAAAESASSGSGTVNVSSSSVCYHSNNTFGSHLNHYVGGRFLNDSERAYRDLLPFFASRIVLGSGGFAVGSGQRPGFVLCPRAGFIRTDIGSDSTGSRPLIHTRGESEPLSTKGSRLHDIALAAPISPLATYLRFATSSLVIALLDRGHRPERVPQLRTPAFEAMQKWNTDITLKRRVASNVGLLTILDMQRIYFDFVADHLKDAPSFAEESLNLWARLLDQLEAARDSDFEMPALVESLDWVRKRLIYEHFLKTRGGDDWNLARLATVLGGIRSGRGRRQRLPTDPNSSPAELLRMISLRRAAEKKEESKPKPQARLNAEQAQATQLRNQLYALDTQYADIGKPGLGQLKWELPEVGVGQPQIDAVLDGRNAAETPTRCRRRGHFIQLWGKSDADRNQRSVTWNSIVDRRTSRALAMDDPFDNAIPGDGDPAWKTFDTRPPRPSRNPLAQEASSRVHHALGLYDRGSLIEANDVMQGIPRRGAMQGSTQSCFLRYWSWISVRLGNLQDALEHLNNLYGRDRQPAQVSTFRELLAWLAVWRHGGLAAGPARVEFGIWAKAGKRMIGDRRLQEHSDVVAVLGHLCMWETFVAHQPEQGLATAERALSLDSNAALQGFPRQRIWQSVARVQVANHRFDDAEALLKRCAEKCESQNYHGELAQVKLMQAQASYIRHRRGETLEFDAAELLQEARAIVADGPSRNPVTLARIEAASARVLGTDNPHSDEARERLTLLCQPHDGLNDPLGTEIVDNWNSWIAGDPSPSACENGASAPLNSSATDRDWWGL